MQILSLSHNRCDNPLKYCISLFYIDILQIISNWHTSCNVFTCRKGKKGIFSGRTPNTTVAGDTPREGFNIAWNAPAPGMGPTIFLPGSCVKEHRGEKDFSVPVYRHRRGILRPWKGSNIAWNAPAPRMGPFF